MKIGRLRINILRRGLRHSEVRWMGPNTQWVISPVQIALWTHMRNGWHGEPYRWRIQRAPLSR